MAFQITKGQYQIGDEIAVPWSDGTKTYDFVWIVAHESTAELEDGSSAEGVYLQAKYCLPFATPFDAKEPSNSNNYIKGAGCICWKLSNIRQYLNGSGTSWFTKQTDFDILASEYSEKQGFISGFQIDFVNAIKAIKVNTQNFDPNDGSVGTDITYDRFFLPSLEQHHINPTTTYNITRGVEGEAWDYWKKVQPTEASIDNSYEPFQISELGGNSSNSIFLRSTTRVSYEVACITASYTVSSFRAYYGFNTAPACFVQYYTPHKPYIVQDTSLIEIADAIRSKIPLVVTDKFKLISLGLATSDMFTVGDQITVPWSDGTTTYDFVWDVAHFATVELEDGSTVNGMYLQAHYCLPFNTPFDGEESGNSDSNVNRLGSNRWKTSNLRQYLNGKGSSWFTKQTNSDVLASQYSNVQGFMSGFGDDFLNILKPVKVSTQCNTVNDGGGTDITYDTFFPPSLEQHFINPTSTFNVTRGVEGEAWAYWKKVASDKEYSYNYTVSNFTTYDLNDKSTARSVFLRSTNRNNSYNVAGINDSGHIMYFNALAFGRVSPACFVPLSDSATS